MLRELVNEGGIPVLCFGLRTDFMTKLFPGSCRLFSHFGNQGVNHEKSKEKGIQKAQAS